MRFSNHQFVLCKQRLRMGSALLCGLFLQILLTLTALVPTSDAQLTQSDINQIETGLRLGREIATVLERETFPVVLKTVAAYAGPYLSTFGTALSLIFSFIPTKSAELQYMETLKEHIDTRFDRLDFRFNEIERKIDWSVVKINFKQIEQNILVMSDELKDLVTIQKRGFNHQKSLFMSRYDNMFDESGKKLYILSKTIGSSLMKYTKNDRAETSAFLRGVLQLVMEAVKIELTYYKVKEIDVAVAEQAERNWVTKIGEMLVTFKQVDGSVQRAFHSQCLQDTNEIVVYNKQLSNEDLSNLLYNELTRKYYWRDWMVLVYNPVEGWENHGIITCGGGHFFRLHGYNVVIASVDKSKRAFDLARARQTLLGETVDRAVPKGFYFSSWVEYENLRADKILNSMDTSFACSTAIVCRYYNKGWFQQKCDLHANFPETRGVSVQRGLTMIMFG